MPACAFGMMSCAFCGSPAASHASARACMWCAPHPAAFGRVQRHGRRRATTCRRIACEGAERGSSETRSACGRACPIRRHAHCAERCVPRTKHTMNNLACRLQPAARGLRQRRAAYPLQQNVRETRTRGRGVLHVGSLCCAAIRARNRECGLLPVPVRVSQSIGLSGNGQVLEAA